MTPDSPADRVEAFIARWQGQEGGQERANYALFLSELCGMLGLPPPDPAGATHERNDYVFERVVTHRRDEGDTIGRIDLYKRNSFVLEAKQSRQKGGKKEIAGQNDLFAADTDPPERGKAGARRAWDVLMLNAKRQAEEYARALPAAHGWPPFILVCDVGHCIEAYADFTGQGKNYTQFPDRQSFRIYLEDLRQPEVRERLQAVWRDPQSLDPARTRARVTRDIAARLAEVSRALESKKYPPEEVAHFLMRCLFTMFAASVKLLPENAFRDLLDDCRNNPAAFAPLLGELWRSMNDGAFSTSIRSKVLKFNGNLFAEAKVLPLGREEIGELYEAAQKDWRAVEPAIFGTLLEQALDQAERRRLGAHYTPRAYVERLVVATIIEPLREDWRNVQAAAETRRAAGDLKGAAAEVKTFHDRLCATRVLDPACGTGNFLYVAMELMKRLEGEVLEALVDLGGQEALRGLGGHTVDPHQFLGMEINPRAAAIAELVLWIGYLQWHFRTRGGTPEQPILKKFKNIDVKNAVLTWDGYPAPQVIDGKEAYPNPRQPTWPDAEFIVGNPPFMAGQDFRREFGSAYAEALWSTYPNISGGSDFVMFWWERCAHCLTVSSLRLRRFGLVATNSITQEFSHRVLVRWLHGRPPISIVMAIPDHPWTRASKDAANVRIAMTVVERGRRDGILNEVIREEQLESSEPEIEFKSKIGEINAHLKIGTNFAAVRELRANAGICHDGVKLHGAGFILRAKEAELLRPANNGYNSDPVIRPYRNGRDLTGMSRDVWVIDLFGLSANHVRLNYPNIYQHLLNTVKPERDRNNRATYRTNWWVFGEPRSELRPALVGLQRYVATVDTAKHRIFQFLPADFLCDDGVVLVALNESYALGVLSSRIHLAWALRRGSRLEDRPRYPKSLCFDPFPFPSPGELLKAQIRDLAEELDGFRKARQQEHPSLTLTQMYNVLEKLKAIDAMRVPQLTSPRSRGEVGPIERSEIGPGEGGSRYAEAVESPPHLPALRAVDLSPQAGRGDGPQAGRGEPSGARVPELTPAEEEIKDKGLILILKELHEKLDRLVFEAYGWPPTLSDEEILERLVALNRERAAEERRGHVRWLRPEYQIPRFGKDIDKMAAKEEGAQIAADLGVSEPAARKPSFPADAVAQTAAVFAALASAGGPTDAAAIAGRYRRTRTLEQTVSGVLDSLARLGHATTRDGRTFELRRIA